MAKFESKPKMAIFGQAPSYIRSESNYCQNWQYLDKLPLKRKRIKLLPKLAIFGQAASKKEANQIIAKNGKI